MIVGVDEVGRGCLAGPIVAGAVVLEKRMTGLRDSKIMTKIARERSDIKIRAKAAAYGIGWVSSLEIDEIGVTNAIGLAMQRAVEQITIDYDEIVIDGNHNYLAQMPKSRCLIKADSKVKEVSAASIIAKVARDKYMAQMSETYPGYGFENHVGYGTVQHMNALQKLGVVEIHRRCYSPVKALLEV